MFIKNNYLNNKDLLKEIHLSKCSYCSFLNPEKDNKYDIILNSVNDINEENIEKAKLNKVARILKEQGTTINKKDISDQDLIFRVMTWEHVPMQAVKSKIHKKNKVDILQKFFDEIDSDSNNDNDNVDDIKDENVFNLDKIQHVKVNFPPFFHYQLNEKKVPCIVGKSHWKGNLDNGYFCKDQGKLTNNLALMLMKLVEKYSMKSNWRNYSYREEMVGQAIVQLCQVALQFDESKSNNPFAFYTSIGRNSFLRILNTEKRNQQIRDDLLVQNQKSPSYTRTNNDIGWED